MHQESLLLPSVDEDSTVAILKYLETIGYQSLSNSFTLKGLQSQLNEIVARIHWVVMKQVVATTSWSWGRPILKVIGLNDKILLVGVPDVDGELWTLAINNEDADDVTGLLRCNW